jgi:hypothetical protein
MIQHSPGRCKENISDGYRNGGYDDKFKTYASSVADSAGKSIQKFMEKHGNDYFSCIVTEPTLCCASCKDEATGRGDPCARCVTGDKCRRQSNGARRDMQGRSALESDFSNVTSSFGPGDITGVNSVLSQRGDGGPPNSVPSLKYVKVAEPCPPDYSQRGKSQSTTWDQSVSWTLRGDQSDKFFADLLGDTGIPKSKIKFGTNNRVNSCQPWLRENDGNLCWNYGYDFNYPQPNGYGAGDVSNPKAVVQKALESSNNIQQQLSNALTKVKLQAYYADEWELVDAVSIPVLLIAHAIEEMNQVEEIADKIDEQKKKALILAFIGAILFFIPIAGEVLGSVVEVGDLAAILTLVSAAGDVATGVYSIVDDPQNPLLGIMQIVLAPLALANVGQVAKAASIRRGMSDDDILKLGGKLAASMSTIKKVAAACKR